MAKLLRRLFWRSVAKDHSHFTAPRFTAAKMEFISLRHGVENTLNRAFKRGRVQMRGLFVSKQVRTIGRRCTAIRSYNRVQEET